MDGGPHIAIDAMGGDAGPAAMIAGAARALRQDSTLRFTFYGDETKVRDELERHPGLHSRIATIHSPESIEPSETPSQAIRRARTLPRFCRRSARTTSSCSTSARIPSAMPRTWCSFR